MKLPLAKNNDIIVQETGNELLVYNLKTHKAYRLNETSKIVYNASDGKTSFNDLKRKYKFTDDIIYLALDELKRNDLIVEDYQSKFVGVSRREVIKRVGLASMVALPAISSLVAPKAAQAASSCICPSTEPTGCQDGGSYSLGCYRDFPSCSTAAAVSAGNDRFPNHCCKGLMTVSRPDLVTGCCAVACN